MLRLAKIVLTTLAYLVAFDLIGVVACALFDIAGVLPLKIGATSTALYYTVWIVDGIFCGLLTYDAAGKLGSTRDSGDWTSHADAPRTGLLVLAVESTLVVALAILFRSFVWAQNAASDFYAPDSQPVTLVFFAAIVASVVLAHTRLRPAPAQ